MTKLNSTTCTEAQMARQLWEQGVPFVVFDLETTGLKRKEDRILSFSALWIRQNEAGINVQGNRMNLFINPGRQIPEKITQLNHITNEMVKDCPQEREAAPMIRAFLGDVPYLMSYNGTAFDIHFLHAMFERVYGIADLIRPAFHLDVMRLAKSQMPNLQNYKLQTVAHELGVDMGLTFHQSMDDVIATARVGIRLMKTLDGEKEKNLPRVKVTNATYWSGPGHFLSRIYISTWPRTKTYYDVFKKTWTSDADIDIESLRRDVLSMYKIPVGLDREAADKAFAKLFTRCVNRQS